MPARVEPSGRRRLDHGGGDRLAELGHDVVVDGDEELVAVGEALVEVAGVEAGPLAHRPHRRAGVALGAQEVEAGVDQLRAPLGGPLLGGDAGPPAAAQRGGCGAGLDLTWQRALP